METDYMFAVQEICIKLIYIPPTIKKKNYVDTWLEMIAGLFFLTPISSEVLQLSRPFGLSKNDSEILFAAPCEQFWSKASERSKHLYT